MLKKGSTGELGEGIAAKYLRGKGYDILAVDVHTGKFGEIDIVARKDGRLFFVEVKTRSGNMFGSAAESLTFKKRGRLRRAVQYYLIENKIGSDDYQADLIAIDLDKISKKATIKHFESIEI